MNPRKSATIVGILFIIATVSPILTFYFLDSLGSPDYLVNIAANETKIIQGMVVELVWALAVVGIPIMAYSVLKKHDKGLARWFLGFRSFEAVSVLVHSIILLPLLKLSQEYVTTGAPIDSYHLARGGLLLATREVIFLIGSGLVWSLSALILNYALYKSKLVPKWLSGWGLVGGVLSLTVYLSQVFSMPLTDWLFLPIALQEMVFAVWLIVKGFNPSAITSVGVRTEGNEVGAHLE
jgi:hypothetical protein